MELAGARELVAHSLWEVEVAASFRVTVAAAVAALAEPVNQNLFLLLPMVASDYLATSQALRFFMAVVAADLPPTVRMGQLAPVATVAVALAAKFM